MELLQKMLRIEIFSFILIFLSCLEWNIGLKTMGVEMVEAFSFDLTGTTFVRNTTEVRNTFKTGILILYQDELGDDASRYLNLTTGNRLEADDTLETVQTSELWKGCLKAKALSYTKDCVLIPAPTGSDAVAKLGNAIRADQELKMIIVQSSYATFVLATHTGEFTSTLFTIVDNKGDEGVEDYPSEIDRKAKYALGKNLQILRFEESEEGYLAGVLAGLVSTEKKSAFVFVDKATYSGPVKYAHAFKNGMLSICAECTINFEYFGVQDVEINGQNIAQAAYDLLPFDVLYTVNGRAGTGAIKWAVENKIFAIGGTFNQMDDTFGELSSVAQKNYYLSNTVKSFQVASFKTIKENYLNNFQSGSNVIGLSYNAVSINQTVQTNQIIPDPFQNIANLQGLDEYKCPVKSARRYDAYLQVVRDKLSASAINTGVDTNGYLEEWVPDKNKYSMPVLFGERPPRLQGHTVTRLLGLKLFVFGGSLSDGTFSNTLYRINIVESKWDKPTFDVGTDFPIVYPTARRFHAAGTFTDETLFEYLYIVGGESAKDKVTCEIWRYESMNRLTYIPSSTLCASRTAYASISDGLYIFGGIDQNLKLTNELRVLNMTTEEVSIVKQSGDIPSARSYAHATSINNTLYLFGGTNGTHYFNDVYSFDPKSSSWIKYSNIAGIQPSGRAAGLMTAIDTNRLLISGGHNTTHQFSENVILHLTRRLWIWTDTDPLPFNLSFAAGINYKFKEGDCKWVNNQNGLETGTLCDDSPANSHPRLLVYGGLSGNKTFTNISSNIVLYTIGDEQDQYPSCAKGKYLLYDKANRPVCYDCPKDNYNIKTGENVCHPCPPTGICPGGSTVLVKFGYWQDPTSLTDDRISKPAIFRCDSRTCCNNVEGCTVETQCKNGTTGPLCSRCEKEGYSMYSGKCIKCTETNGSYVMVFIAIAVGIVIFFCFFSGEAKSSVFSPNVSLCFQIIGLVTQTQTGSFQSILIGLSRMDVMGDSEISIMPDICLTPATGIEKAVIRIVSPFVIAAIFVIFYTIAYIWHSKLNDGHPVITKIHQYLPSKLRNRNMLNFKQAAIQVSLFVFFPVLNAALVVLACKSYVYGGNPIQLMKQYPDIECWTGRHVHIAVGASIIIFVLLILLPSMVALYYFKFKRIEQFAPFAVPYKDEYSYWAIFEYFERILIAIISVSTADFLTFAWAVLLGVLVIMVFQRFNPYKEQQENWSKNILVVAMIGSSGLGILQKQACIGIFANYCTTDALPYQEWQLVWIMFPIVLVAHRGAQKAYDYIKKWIESFLEKRRKNGKENASQVAPETDTKESSAKESDKRPSVRTTLEMKEME